MPTQYRQVIRGAIGELLSSGFATRKQAVDPQLLAHILSYLAAKDWMTIESATRPNQIMMVCGERIQRLGIKSLHEQTAKWIVAIVLHYVKKATRAWPRYHMIYQWVHDFKTRF